MFKKTLLATATTAALLGPVAAFAAGDFGNGTITFTGSVIEAPCSISAADTNMTIDMGQVSKKDLTATGKFSTSVPINIHMTGCTFDADPAPPAGTGNANGKLSKIGVTFQGTSATPASGLLTNIGGAANVVVQLLNKDNNTPINIGTPATAANAQQMTASNGVLNFFARLMATGVGGAGSINSTATYSLTYF
ncbi:fimbrial protein [Achromobacter sp. 2789STDY5608621]|uniref:fimbrial protein n=1 Tax=Achromobacter sp. 2789STDY5608621 TaxID=1806496 RepID=UPI0006C70A2A|nr:fimbrial protein [Achromobacter sp. 2789STDY5608621]CUI30367.1 fimbrial protein StdA [Achromobacter sp. 2789STDY5608621]